MPRILVSCGEPSGDLYAGDLVRALRALDPSVEITGFGGERLRGAGATLVGHFRGLTVTGLVEVLRILPRSWRMYRRLLQEAASRPPDVFVAIDFPDFNFRVAAALKRRGVPVVYYVSPQIWAWRGGRIRAMKQFVDRMLVIFPFEVELYRKAGIPVEFVGHPLLDLAQALTPRQPFLASIGLDPEAPTVAVLPGSRPNEVREILPGLARAAALIATQVPHVQFVLARAPNLDSSLFGPFGAAELPAFALVEEQTDNVLGASDVVLTASGTATVQAAIHGRPMVIVYRVAPMTYLLGRRFVRVESFGMVNLVAGRRIMPELLQRAFTPEAVANEAIDLLSNPRRAEDARAALEDVRARLGEVGASRRAAEAILRIAAGGHAATDARMQETTPP